MSRRTECGSSEICNQVTIASLAEEALVAARANDQTIEGHTVDVQKTSLQQRQTQTQTCAPPHQQGFAASAPASTDATPPAVRRLGLHVDKKDKNGSGAFANDRCTGTTTVFGHAESSEGGTSVLTHGRNGYPEDSETAVVRSCLCDGVVGDYRSTSANQPICRRWQYDGGLPRGWRPMACR